MDENPGVEKASALIDATIKAEAIRQDFIFSVNDSLSLVRKVFDVFCEELCGVSTISIVK